MFPFVFIESFSLSNYYEKQSTGRLYCCQHQSQIEDSNPTLTPASLLSVLEISGVWFISSQHVQRQCCDPCHQEQAKETNSWNSTIRRGEMVGGSDVKDPQRTYY